MIFVDRCSLRSVLGIKVMAPYIGRSHTGHICVCTMVDIVSRAYRYIAFDLKDRLKNNIANKGKAAVLCRSGIKQLQSRRQKNGTVWSENVEGRQPSRN